MDLRNLNTFIQVAESGSFTRAGELLGYSQPTISVQIKQLENELGGKLFDRIGHTVRLTDKGRDMLVHAQQVCHICQEMASSARQDAQPHGMIRMATADSLCAPLFCSELDAFQSAYPHISLKVITAGTGDLFRLLDHNEADLVCTLDSHIYNTSYIIAAEKQVGVHFVVPAEHPLAKEPAVSLDALLQYPFLLTEKGMSYRRLMDETLARKSMEVQPVFECGRPDILCQLVEQGLGISFLPDPVTEAAVGCDRVVQLNVPDCAPELWAQLLYHKDKWISPQMEAVITHFSALLT